jgi:hypothetical protein
MGHRLTIRPVSSSSGLSSQGSQLAHDSVPGALPVHAGAPTSRSCLWPWEHPSCPPKRGTLQHLEVDAGGRTQTPAQRPATLPLPRSTRDTRMRVRQARDWPASRPSRTSRQSPLDWMMRALTRPRVQGPPSVLPLSRERRAPCYRTRLPRARRSSAASGCYPVGFLTRTWRKYATT